MLIAIFAFVLMVGHITAEIPSYIHICGRRDPNLDQCIVDSVKNMKHKLCAGIPELSVPSIEPIVIDKIVILDSPNSKLRLSNLIINGLCDYNVTSFHMDLEHNRYDLDLSFKHLLINATYDFDIRLLVPIVQKGNVFITTDNVNTKTDMDMKIVTKNGKRYTYMSRMKIDIDMKDYNINYDLNDKELGELRKAISSFIGNNQQDVIAAVKTPLEQAISKRILELSNNIVKHFTFEELFPDRE